MCCVVEDVRQWQAHRRARRCWHEILPQRDTAAGMMFGSSMRFGSSRSRVREGQAAAAGNDVEDVEADDHVPACSGGHLDGVLHRQSHAHEQNQREFLHDPAVQVKFFGWLVPLAIPLPCDAYRKRNPTSRGSRTMPKFRHAYPGSSAGHSGERQ